MPSSLACNKEEGTGGTSTLEGRVLKVPHNDDHGPIPLYPIFFCQNHPRAIGPPPG